MKEIISHVRKNVDGSWEKQYNDDHQQGVAQRAAHFAAPFGMAEWGRVLGLLHDKGKEKRAFQQHIIKESGMDPAMKVEGDYRHAYVGALLAQKYFKSIEPFLAYPILGHHTGLYDYFKYEQALSEKTIPTDVSDEKPPFDIIIPEILKQAQPFMMNHVIRVLFSCLVDADFLNTEEFMKPEEVGLRKMHDELQVLLPKLEAYIQELSCNSPITPVNKIRNEIQFTCANMSDRAPGFYSLTVPTGGGKTLSSLLWAMKHAVKYGKKRIIIAIPYTSIITQTAEKLRGIFGSRNVLEHHSNASFDEIADNDDETFTDEEKKRLAKTMKLATENWDYPVVITTNVQLFESIYSNKPSQCRKLHNLCDSVLILDEVQSLPTNYLQPIVNALKTYQQLFGTTVLFTTASQPVLEGEHRGNNPKVRFYGINKITEIIPDNILHEWPRRVKLHFDENRSSYDEIAERLAKFDKVLCVVNTRKDAVEIYKRLPREYDGLTLHLSRMMCPKHIKETIEKIKIALDPKNKVRIIRVVATQLIEAGVDIDFPVVFRQEAGLDSIIQAAGRCNREGTSPTPCDVYIFKLPLEQSYMTGQMKRAKNAFERIFPNLDDPLNSHSMRMFFNKLYQMSPTFDESNKEGYNIFDMLEDEIGNLEFPNANIAEIDYRFQMAADSFRLIDDKQISVIVNYTDIENASDKTYVEKLIDKLLEKGMTYSLVKELSQFTVSISKKAYDNLQGDFMLDERLPKDIHFLMNRNQYDEKIGIVIRNLYIEEPLIC